MNHEKQPNPWFSIWTHPRATIVRIVSENPNRSLWCLAGIYGFSSLLNFFQSLSLGMTLGPIGILILAIILAPFWGYLTFTVWSWVVAWTGRWFRGAATFSEIRAAYAWSCVPFALNIPLWLFMIVLFGQQLFLNFPEGYLLTDGQITLLFAILIAKVVLAVWSLIIYLNALAEVQKYSILRSILNTIVAGLIVGIVVAVLWFMLLAALGVTVEPAKTAFFHEGTTLELLMRGGL